MKRILLVNIDRTLLSGHHLNLMVVEAIKAAKFDAVWLFTARIPIIIYAHYKIAIKKAENYNDAEYFLTHKLIEYLATLDLEIAGISCNMDPFCVDKMPGSYYRDVILPFEENLLALANSTATKDEAIAALDKFSPRKFTKSCLHPRAYPDSKMAALSNLASYLLIFYPSSPLHITWLDQLLNKFDDHTLHLPPAISFQYVSYNDMETTETLLSNALRPKTSDESKVSAGAGAAVSYGTLIAPPKDAPSDAWYDNLLFWRNGAQTDSLRTPLLASAKKLTIN